MDTSALIKGFSVYLQDLNEVSSKNYNTDPATISIFMYATEFKRYIVDELNVDSSIFSKSINDILDMDVVNGQLVEKEDGNSDKFESSQKTENSDDASQTPDLNTEEGKSNGILEILNNIFQDQSVIDSLDMDKSGDLDKEEISSFLDRINGVDGDSDNISFEDIITGLSMIKEATAVTTPEENSPENTTPVEENTDVTQPSDVSPAASNSGTQGTGGTNGSSGVRGTQTVAPQEKTLDMMDEDELNDELETATGDLTTNKEALDKAYTNLDDLRLAIDESFKEYTEQIRENDKELADKMDALGEKISEKRKEIDDNDKAISDQENTVSECNTAYENAVSKRENLDSIVSNLDSTDTTDMNDAQKKELADKLAAAKIELQDAINAEKAAEEAKEKAEEKLDELKENKEKLESSEEGQLGDLEQQLSELEAEALEAYPEVQQAYDDYKKAEKEYSDYKTNDIPEAKKAVQDSQNYVNEVQAAIANYDRNQDTKDYSLDPKYLYNEEWGQKLAQNAKTVPGTKGWCLSGVSQSLMETYGVGLSGLGSAYKAAEALRGNTPGYEAIASHFVEVKVNRNELANLPAGAIVVWDNNQNGGGSNVSERGKIHGHISIALGNGQESSDHIAGQTVNRDAEFTVFYPI